MDKGITSLQSGTLHFPIMKYSDESPNCFRFLFIIKATDSNTTAPILTLFNNNTVLWKALGEVSMTEQVTGSVEIIANIMELKFVSDGAGFYKILWTEMLSGSCSGLLFSTDKYLK